jgi:hypothetical protein
MARRGRPFEDGTSGSQRTTQNDKAAGTLEWVVNRAKARIWATRRGSSDLGDSPSITEQGVTVQKWIQYR